MSSKTKDEGGVGRRAARKRARGRPPIGPQVKVAMSPKFRQAALGAARADGVSLSGFVRVAVAEKLDRSGWVGVDPEASLTGDPFEDWAETRDETNDGVGS